MAHPLITGALDYHKASQQLGLSAYELEYVNPNRRYYYGDHWQDGLGYIGPPPATDTPFVDELWQGLRRAFVSKNIPREIVDRQAGAVMGNEPDYGFTVRRSRKKVLRQIPDPAFVPDPAKPEARPPMVDHPQGEMIDEPLKPEEQALIDEAMAAVAVVWTKRKARKLLRELLIKRLWGGRAYLRAVVPDKYRVNSRIPRAATLTEAMERVVIDAPDIEDAVNHTDSATQDTIGFTRYEREVEGQKIKVIEISFVDDTGQTYVATTQEAQPLKRIGTGEPIMLPPAPADVVARAQAENPLPNLDLSDPLNLGGHITQYEMTGEPLLSPQVRQNTAFVNLAMTMAAHVLVESGFSELTVTNVEMETVKVPDSRVAGGYREVPKKLRRGGTVVNNLVGMAQYDGKGGETLATPTVNYKDPTAVDVFDVGKQLGYRNVLEEVHQVHALIAGDATPSGESRITALADFIMFSLDFKSEMDDAGVWLLEVLLYWAAELIGQPGRFNGLRATFDSKLYAGKITADERRLLLEELKARVRDRESVMMLLGINDPAAMKEKIDGDAPPPSPAPPQPPNNNPPQPPTGGGRGGGNQQR